MTADNEDQPRPEFFKIKGSERIFTMFPDGRLFEVVDFDTKEDLIKDSDGKSKKDLNSEQVYNSSEEDNTKPLDGRPAIKNKMESDMEKVNASDDELDGSIAIKERMILDCQEKTGMSYEECSEKVSKKMSEKGLENANVDMKDKQTEEKTERIEVCKKEYDFLKEKYEELKEMQKEKENQKKELDSFKKDFNELSAYVDKLKEKQAEENEAKRQEKIKEISRDFVIPEEELKDKNMSELSGLERLFDIALKRDTQDEIPEDVNIDEANEQVQKIRDRFKMKF